jgi:sugar lactone lactonase YvrE
MRYLTLALFTLAAAHGQTAPSYNINTYAGSFVPDGAPALSVALLPTSVAVDANGVVHITDLNVLRLGADGNLSVEAGTVPGYAGDGGPANQAAVSTPDSVAFDAAGNMYIADWGNRVIRKVDASTGAISTFAGTGHSGSTGDGGPATSANITRPFSIVCDGNNLYVSDSSTMAIRKIVLATGVISTIPTGFKVGFNRIRGIALDNSGNLYVADAFKGMVMKVDPATGGVTTVTSSLDTPQSVAFDGAGNLYIGDTGTHTIRKIAAGTQTITTIAGPDTGAQLSDQFEIAVDAGGNIYVADTSYGLVSFIAAGSGALQTIAGGGGGDGGPATQAQFFYPGLIAIDGLGNLYVPERGRIREVDPTGLISTAAGTGLGGFSGDNGPAQGARLGFYPNGVTIDSAGNLFIADTNNSVIRKVDHVAGTIATVAGNPQKPCTTGKPVDGPALAQSLCHPFAVAVDKGGNLYIADYDYDIVRKVAAGTGMMTIVAGGDTSFAALGDGGPATKASVSPACVWLDAAGNLFICDDVWNVVRRVDAATGIITTVAGIPGDGGTGDSGGPATKTLLSSPDGVVQDTAGNLIIADTGNERIVRVDAKTGILATIAGTGVVGYSGDGGPALAAQFSFPTGLAVDAAGNIYVADYGNHRIRVLQPAQ